MTGLAWDQVVAGYGGRPVLRDVTFEVAPGELVAVLGTNGAGKSTLLRVATGLVACEKGRVRVGGQDATRMTPERRWRDGLALAAGADTTFPPLDVTASLLLAERGRKYDDDMRGWGVDWAFAAFPELARRRRTVVAALSSGERQLLALAQALLRRPRILLVDELSRALSPPALGLATAAVRSAHAAGATVIVVDQSADVALDLAPRACFLDGGRLVFDGPSHELRRRDDLLRPIFLPGRE